MREDTRNGRLLGSGRPRQVSLGRWESRKNIALFFATQTVGAKLEEIQKRTTKRERGKKE